MNPPYLFPVCYGDTDAGGVVYFARYLEMCERAWTDYLKKRSWNLAEKAHEGIILTVKRVEADYLSPARHGMIVEIITSPKELSRASFWFHHLLRDHQTHIPLAEIRTQMVALNPSGKVLRLPLDLKRCLTEEG